MREEFLSDRLAEVLLPLKWPDWLQEEVQGLLDEALSNQGAAREQEISRLERQKSELEAKLSQGLDKFLEGKVPENLRSGRDDGI